MQAPGGELRWLSPAVVQRVIAGLTPMGGRIELMYARDMEEQEAIDFLENLLEDIGRGRAPDEGSAAAARGAEALVD